MDTPLTLIEQGIIGILAFVVLVLIGVLLKIYFASLKQTDNYATTITNLATQATAALLETASAVGTLKETLKSFIHEFGERLVRMEGMIKELYDWHNHTDSSGVRSWFTPTRDIEDLKKSIEVIDKKLDKLLRQNGGR